MLTKLSPVNYLLASPHFTETDFQQFRSTLLLHLMYLSTKPPQVAEFFLSPTQPPRALLSLSLQSACVRPYWERER